MLRYIESKHAINKTIKHIEQSNIDPRVIIDQFRKDRDDKRIRDNMVWEQQKLIELKKKYE